MSDDNKKKVYSPFQQLNRKTGEFEYVEVNNEPQTKTGYKTVVPKSTTTPTTGKNLVVRNTQTTAKDPVPPPYRTVKAVTTQQPQAPKKKFFKTRDDGQKEYLVLIKLEEQDMMVPDHESTRYLTAISRELIYTKVKAFIQDTVTVLEDEGDSYDPIEYDNSYVLCEGVTLSQRVTLLEFLELCIKKYGVKENMDKYIKSIIEDYKQGGGSANNEYRNSTINELDYGENCRPQVQAFNVLGECDGEDIN